MLKTAGFVETWRRWRPTHLAGQVPLGFGCQEGQGVKTKFKAFGLLVFPAALIQFLRGVRKKETIFTRDRSLRLCNDPSGRQTPATPVPQTPRPQKPCNSKQPDLLAPALTPLATHGFSQKKQTLNSRGLDMPKTGCHDIIHSNISGRCSPALGTFPTQPAAAPLSSFPVPQPQDNPMRQGLVLPSFYQLDN